MITRGKPRSNTSQVKVRLTQYVNSRGMNILKKVYGLARHLEGVALLRKFRSNWVTELCTTEASKQNLEIYLFVLIHSCAGFDGKAAYMQHANQSAGHGTLK